MVDKQNLIFGLHGSLYGINTTFVREICWLPELYSLATAPADIIGIFNWRSHLVPVLHLDLRFGRGFSGCNMTDRVIVVEDRGTYIGIVAHQVYDVRELKPQPLDLDLIQSRQSALDRQFIIGIAQSDDSVVTCLDLDRLIREPDAVAALDNESPPIAGAAADFYSRCCPEATVDERATFATRAAQLKTSVIQAQSNEREEGVLVVQIGAESIGLPLELIIDVDTVDRFTISPVPVAPPALLGQINWRGEILPVVELGGILQILPVLPRQEIVIIQLGDIKLGIGVDRIFDVFYLSTARIEELPLSASDRLRGYLRGVTKYGEGLMYLVKLQDLVAREFLPQSVA
ncbi:chemotaxis protein CheW [Chamaesiphon minutus]|uniref:Chemotaxis signal transduction protein n=1 Tax=Chamaesiphon minutus (strain ATCC 27169 / PCC 6605) TaxID=1173020 RepID=K9UMC0_CHAP6|nr:chemotaxis protein CheW [Chamaesiphon minutus]AFY95334.1 chemotaxis signal transduction protein [Chamaesiphon minutus PCC 6605]